MNEAVVLSLDALAGVLLGAFFFGGLWWTIRKGVDSKNPALLFACSMITRTAVALLGFYLVTRWNGFRLLACLGGFIAARIAAGYILFSKNGAK